MVNSLRLGGEGINICLPRRVKCLGLWLVLETLPLAQLDYRGAHRGILRPGSLQMLTSA